MFFSIGMQHGSLVDRFGCSTWVYALKNVEVEHIGLYEMHASVFPDEGSKLCSLWFLGVRTNHFHPVPFGQSSNFLRQESPRPKSTSIEASARPRQITQFPLVAAALTALVSQPNES